MGLIKELVLLPVAPVRFTVWVAEQVDAEVQRREGGRDTAVARIEAAEEARERGEIDAAEAERIEGEAIERQLAGPGAARGREGGDG